MSSDDSSSSSDDMLQPLNLESLRTNTTTALRSQLHSAPLNIKVVTVPTNAEKRTTPVAATNTPPGTSAAPVFHVDVVPGTQVTTPDYKSPKSVESGNSGASEKEPAVVSHTTSNKHGGGNSGGGSGGGGGSRPRKGSLALDTPLQSFRRLGSVLNEATIQRPFWSEETKLEVGFLSSEKKVVLFGAPLNSGKQFLGCDKMVTTIREAGLDNVILRNG
eukprot:PhF_6_TR16957/c0_g1_i2/m.25584